MATIQRHRYRLQANAFYQQAWSARQNTPPSQTHPAFRQPDLISNLASPIPRLSPTPTPQPQPQRAQAPTPQRARSTSLQTRPQALTPQRARSPSPHTYTQSPEARSYTHSPLQSPSSAVTTMSSFQRAGRPQESPSPPLNLGTTPDQSPRPTQRAYIEDRQEQAWYESLTPEQRANYTSVFRPPPRDSTDRTQANVNVVPASTTSPNMQRERSSVKFARHTDEIPGKTPKKGGFLASLRRPFQARRRSEGVVSTPRQATPTPGRAPPKASQLLSLARSPSRTARRLGRTSIGEDAQASSKKKEEEEEGQESQEPAPRSHTSMGHRGEDMPQSARGLFNLFRRGSNQMAGTPTTGLTRSQSLKFLDPGVPPTPPSKDTPPDERIIRDMIREDSPIHPFANHTPTRSTGFVSTSSRMSPARTGSYGRLLAPTLATVPSVHSLRGDVAIDAQSSNPAAVQEMNGRPGGLGLEGLSMPAELSQRTPNMVYSPSNYSGEWARDGEVTPTAPAGPSPQMEMVRRTRSVSVGSLHTGTTSATGSIAYPELRRDASIVAFQNYGPTPPSNRGRLALENAFEELDEQFQNSATPVAAGFQHYIDPAIRNLPQEPETSPASQHPSAQVSPLQPQRNDNLEILQPTVYRRQNRSTPQASQNDETSTSARRPDNIVDSAPILNPSNVQQAGGINFTPRSRRLPRSSDVSPSTLRGISAPRTETRAPSPSRIPRPSRANQADTSRSDQAPTSLSAGVQTSRLAPPSLANNASVTRMTSLRQAEIRGFIRDSQLFNNSLAGRLRSQGRRPPRHESGDDTGEDSDAGIPDYKNNSGREREHRRTSTAAAHNFYLQPPPGRRDTPGSSRSGTPSTAATFDSEASTIIEHANLPHGFPRPPTNGIVTSSQVAGFAPTSLNPRPNITDSLTLAAHRQTPRSTFTIAADRLAALGGQTSSSSASTSSRDMSISSTDSGSDANAASARSTSSTTLPTARDTMASDVPAGGQAAPANTASNTTRAPATSGNMPPTTPARGQATPGNTASRTTASGTMPPTTPASGQPTPRANPPSTSFATSANTTRAPAALSMMPPSVPNNRQATRRANPPSTFTATPAAPSFNPSGVNAATSAATVAPTPVARGGALQPLTQAEQMQALLALAQQQAQQMQHMTNTIQQLQLNQQTYQQANQQATQQITQQTNQAGQQAASQPHQHVTPFTQPNGQGTQQSTTQAAQQTTDSISDEEEDVDGSWFNPG